MKDNINKKFLIITLLILIPIGILYFNMGDELFNIKEGAVGSVSSGTATTPSSQPISATGTTPSSQPTSATTPSSQPTSATTPSSQPTSATTPSSSASVAGSDYVNICHPKKSNFYNINQNALEKVYMESGISANSCKYKCDVQDCDLYLMNTDICKLYKKKTDADSDATFLEVNCNNKVLPSSDPSNPAAPTYSFLGEGKINKNFYKEHKKNFKHINYLLDTANDIKTDYMRINTEITHLKDNPEIVERRTSLSNLYDVVNGKLERVADYLDLSRNKLYSDFVENKYSAHEEGTINLGGTDMSKMGMLREFKKQRDDSLNIDARTINDTLVDERKYFMYTILCILMILSMIILIIFKMAPDLISDKIVVSYFIGVLLLLFFIHYYFKV
jgi:hypothetical protein